MIEKPIICWHCGKLFADLKQGNILTMPSTEIKFLSDKDTQIEIKCPRCKAFTSLIIN